MPLCGDARLRTNCLSYQADNIDLLARKTTRKGRPLDVLAELVELLPAPGTPCFGRSIALEGPFARVDRHHKYSKNNNLPYRRQTARIHGTARG